LNLGKITLPCPLKEIDMQRIYTRRQAQQTTNTSVAGFTLVELLVVVIIIGILAAISLPSYLSLTSSAKQSEARQTMAAILRAQNLWIDRNSSLEYPTSLDQLALGVVRGPTKEDTTSSSIYKYRIDDAVDTMTSQAEPKFISLKAYAGGIRSFSNTSNLATWYSAICESDGAGVGTTPMVPVPLVASGIGATATLDCAPNFHQTTVSGK
jgi:type IV pilus assembly protein PilA